MRINPRLFFYEAYLSLRRNFVMTLVAIIQVAISLLMIGSVYFLVYDSRQIIRALEREVEINVYLEDSISDELFNKYKNEIELWDEVEKVEYRSKEDAYEYLKGMVSEDVLEIIDPESLPVSFAISLNDPKKVEIVANRFKDGNIFDLAEKEEEGLEDHWKWINDLIYGKTYIRNFFKVTNTISILTLLIILILFISSIVLIYNTIRLSTIARRKEIEVMKLVGASNWYVRWPFIIEGIIQGIIGSLIAIVIIFIINISFFKRMENLFNGFFPLPLNLAITGSNPIQLQVFLALLIIGILIGALGSMIALRKFIKI